MPQEQDCPALGPSPHQSEYPIGPLLLKYDIIAENGKFWLPLLN